MTVNQGGQARPFTYDSLARLTGAANPESGTTSYTYDGNGNVITRLDARSITTTYGYDALNRLTTKTYANDPANTPPVTYTYDQTSVTIGPWSSGTLPYPVGRLTEAITTSGGNVQTAVVYNYDQMGRITDFWQCFPSNCGSASLSDVHNHYNLAGDIDWWIHPAGPTITNNISTARRITGVSSNTSNYYQPAILAQNITYTPWGALSTFQDGCIAAGSCTKVQETYDYNNRMQPVRLQLGTQSNTSQYYCMVYNYYVGVGNPNSCTSSPTQAASGNNGNVMGYWYQDNATTGLSHTATYNYDSLNRLATAVATGNSTYNLTYASDRWGNMTCQINGSTNGYCPTWSFDTSTNRISGYFTYDAAGNVLYDGNAQYQWDAEGRLIWVGNGAGTLRTYVWNALGWECLHDTAGNDLGSSSLSDARITWGGKYFAWYQNGVMKFLHYNALGTSTMNLWADGTITNDVIFYPYGDTWATGPYDWNALFASIPDWDWEISLGYTHARWYPLNHERWLSPDPAGLSAVTLADPQTWNMYAYVRNNPTTLTDPTGEYADYDVDKKNKTIRLKLSVGISGKGANVKVAQAMKARIESAWSGTYKDSEGVTWQVKTSASVQVVSNDRQAPGIENFLTLLPGQQGGSFFEPRVNRGTPTPIRR